ncbi:S8/S53 family peptidase [Jatrophihabitans fulvus]
MSESLLPAWADAFTPDALRPVRPAAGVDAQWAFAGATGAGVRVAVVDSGIDFAHRRVKGPSAPGAALRWDRDDERVVVDEGNHVDRYGHGTACAGIIRRAAPEAELMSVRVLGERLTGKGQVFAAGLRWAIEHGARVINLSLSTGRQDFYGLFHEIADEAYFAGVVLVCAMNNVPAQSFPSQYASVVSVAACAGDDPMLVYANPGGPAEFGAPGIDVQVAWLDGKRAEVTGNSFAAPHIAGLVARLLSKHPDLAPYEVKSVLRSVAANAVAANATAANAANAANAVAANADAPDPHAT